MNNKSFINKDKEITLDFNKRPSFNLGGTIYKLSYKFYDNTLDPILKAFNKIKKNSPFENRLVIDFGDSLSSISGEKLIELLTNYQTQAYIKLSNFNINDCPHMFKAIENFL